MNKTPLTVVILAAGKGTRMNSNIPKVLHQINGNPMIIDVIETAKKLNPVKIITIIGYSHHSTIILSYLNGSNSRKIASKS